VRLVVQIRHDLDVGHSMGSFALRNYLQDYPVTMQGVIFMGTGTSPLPLTAALPFIKKMAEKQPKKPFS
jgi:alpha-beta hydrolase superfamily lysophospholipase